MLCLMTVVGTFLKFFGSWSWIDGVTKSIRFIYNQQIPSLINFFPLWLELQPVVYGGRYASNRNCSYFRSAWDHPNFSRFEFLVLLLTLLVLVYFSLFVFVFVKDVTMSFGILGVVKGLPVFTVLLLLTFSKPGVTEIVKIQRI